MAFRSRIVSRSLCLAVIACTLICVSLVWTDLFALLTDNGAESDVVADDLNYTAYLPQTLSLLARMYGGTRQPDSLSMMLPPRQYRAMQCPQLRRQHLSEHRVVEPRPRPRIRTRPRRGIRNDFFRDPYPLCGRYLLEQHTGTPPARFVFVLRAAPSLVASAGEWSNNSVTLEQCGDCAATPGGCAVDVHFAARLLSGDRVLHAEVVPGAAGNWTVRFRAPDPGDYTLEVKMVHLNGGDETYRQSHTLGIVGTHNHSGKRLFLGYHGVCDVQRHVYGSPMRVRVAGGGARAVSELPLCDGSTNYDTTGGGQWVRFANPTNCTDDAGRAHCSGDATSLTDATGLNDHLVWAPSGCQLRIFALGSGGPTSACLQTPPFRSQPSTMLITGDSLAWEHQRNCEQMELHRGGSLLKCSFQHAALPGDMYSAKFVAILVNRTLDGLVTGDRVGVFVTNLGVHHMIGVGRTSQWTALVDAFVAEWLRRNMTVLRGPFTAAPPPGAPSAADAVGPFAAYMRQQNERAAAVIASGQPTPNCVEWAVWLSPPTVHYAQLGMTQQREELWDRIAYERLQQIGFTRIDLITPTRSRPEASHDGLHYLATFHESIWRNKNAQPHKHTGGVSLTLFNILLNRICSS